MGAYKSRPTQVCADEFKRKLVDSYQVVCQILDQECTEPPDILWRMFIQSENVIDYLAKEDININANLDCGFTPLHILSSHGTVEQVLALIQEGAILNNYSKHEFTPLHFATYRNNTEIVAALSQKGADVSAQGHLGVTPLHLAALLGYDKISKILIGKGSKLDFQDEVKFTPLHIACFYGNHEVVRDLVRAGANVNLGGIVGDRPLHLACSRGHISVIEHFLAVPSCDVDGVDNENNTALHYAARQAQTEIVKMLLKHAKAPHSKNIYGDTALHFACYAGSISVVKCIIEMAGPQSLQMENIYSETPLHSACTNGQSIELVKFLLDLGRVDINHQGQDKHTVLHSACYHGHLRLVEYLLNRGADATLLAENKDGGEGQSCLMWAYERGFDDILTLLKRKLRNDDSSSEGSGSDYNLQIPSPLGKIRSMVREKAEVQELRSRLPHNHHIMYREIELFEPIGSGSFGKVFKGHCRNKVVAVKRYRASPFSAKSDVDMFCREVSILCRIKHPNIVKFIGACMEEPCQFAIVTEYVAGGSLFVVLHQQKVQFEMVDILIISNDIACGVDYLHKLKPVPIIHRDLNSHNVLLADKRAIVTDFGESRFILKCSENLTKQPGNLRWMAPEIFTQSTNYTVKADMFSFALCLWELLSSELPFQHLKPAAAAADMAYKNLRPPINTMWPANFQELLRLGWHEDSHERPTFEGALQRYLCIDRTSAEFMSPNGEARDLNKRNNRYFSHLRSKWENGEMLEISEELDGVVPTVEELREQIQQESQDFFELPSVEELREKIQQQQGNIAESNINGYIVDPFKTLSFIQNKEEDDLTPPSVHFSNGTCNGGGHHSPEPNGNEHKGIDIETNGIDMLSCATLGMDLNGSDVTICDQNGSDYEHLG